VQRRHQSKRLQQWKLQLEQPLHRWPQGQLPLELLLRLLLGLLLLLVRGWRIRV